MAGKQKETRCYECNQKGHVYRNCHNNAKKNQQDKNREAVMIGEGKDMAKGKEVIHEITTDQFTPNSMVLGNDSAIGTSLGIGEVLIPSNNHQYVIPYVAYMPNIGLNILSHFQLTAQGFVVDFLDGKCINNRMFEDGISETVSSNEHVVTDQEKLDVLERDISIDIAKKMLTEYVSKHYDKIGESSNQGLCNDKVRENMIIPSDLNEVIGFIDTILLGKIAIEVKDVYSSGFDKMLVWFYKEFLGRPLEKEIPPFVVYKPICLMDFFRIIKELGGGSNIIVKREWDRLTNTLGYPVDYAGTFEDCYLDYLQQLELYYDIGKKMLEENEKEVVEWNGRRIILEVDTFDGFMNIMGIMKHAQTTSKYKEILKRKIQDLVVWFHRDYMNGVFNYPMPPKTGNAEICLFDLFVLVDGMGGSGKVSEEDKWDIVG